MISLISVKLLTCVKLDIRELGDFYETYDLFCALDLCKIADLCKT